MSKHPLDRLTGGEIELNRMILDRAGLVRPTTRFPLVMLHEPPKREVLAWGPAHLTDRRVRPRHRSGDRGNYVPDHGDGSLLTHRGRTKRGPATDYG